ncbi:hypothetical protein ASPCAL12565 [Aspergillus calidoustus]|uniref:Uncharacterized protein n=1 Tax=Aspergillus calidoustus TaxID=454130 RepID=A0A0U5GCE6_ASPCI|nr:hypothetical protein ASPCAL12565 [Aspergillus calidoustus]
MIQTYYPAIGPSVAGAWKLMGLQQRSARLNTLIPTARPSLERTYPQETRTEQRHCPCESPNPYGQKTRIQPNHLTN